MEDPKGAGPVMEKHSIQGLLRGFLYSRWFFGFLALACLIDLTLDVLEEASPGWVHFNGIAIAVDLIAVTLSAWMFWDLSRRRPGGPHGNDPDCR